VFNATEIIEYESELCIGCGNTGTLNNCVSCRAKELGCSSIATAVYLTRGEEGEILDIHRVWIH
jgi:hypothetical protein